MSNRADGSRSSGNKRQTTTLGLEQLESRMLAAFGVLETSLNLLGSSGSLGTTSAVTTSAPTVATPIQLAGGVTEVQSRSIGVTVLGADDGGEANLKYTWRSTSVPSGGRVQFSVNGTNAARNNTLTFTKAGSYTIAVTILDRSGNSTVNTLQFNVAQVLTTFSARNAANAVVTSGSSVTSTGNLRLTVRGFDQFGKVIEQPNITWTTTSAPSEGTATNTVVSGQTNFAFNTAGRFSLRAQSGSAEFNVSVNVSQTLASLSFTTRDGSVVNTTQSTLTSTTNTSVVVRAIDQFGNQMTTTPTLSWSTTRVPAGGSARVVVSAGVATVTFTRAGVYGLQARSGTVFAGFAATVSQTLTSLVTNSGSPANQANDLSLNTTSRSQSLNAVGLDQFGQVMTTRPTVAWSIINSPAADAATLTATGTNARVEVNRPGSYSIRATAGSLTSNVSLNVQRKLARIRVTPGLATVDTGATQLFQASGSDQFGQSMGVAVTWSTSGGSISSTGLLTAPGTTGNYTVTATSGSVTGSASIVVSDLSPTDGIDDPTLSTLITTYYADSSISRVEMIDILRTAGTDGSVNSTEFADFQYLVTGSNFTMPDYVRNLARDVINGNAANATYQGASAGNLAAGSPATLLNNLVNKWFLGTNYPVIVGSGISYRNATGNLFNGSPSRADTRQGQLGDCYFIASLASIADKNPTAVANMFMDNGDGTYTVRFYAGALGLISHSGFVSGGFLSGSGSADYVTVNRQIGRAHV